jgi:hypothetical protein
MKQSIAVPKISEGKTCIEQLSSFDALDYVSNSFDLLDAAPYKIPARDDNYNGDFWKYFIVKTTKNEAIRVSESDATITERIQLRNAAPFAMLPTPLGDDVMVEPTPLRYVLKDGEYYRSLNAADSLPVKTLQVRLRCTDAGGEQVDGTKLWPNRVGLYVLHQEMLKSRWKVIELIPESYESTPASEVEYVCMGNSKVYYAGGQVLPIDLNGNTAQRLSKSELAEWNEHVKHFDIPLATVQVLKGLKPGRQPKYLSQADRKKARRAQNRIASAKRRALRLRPVMEPA